jgi:signal transduction histidine kinase
MTQTAVAYRGQPTLMRQIAEHQRQRLARELHDETIQDVLAAGLAIDLCLADVPPGSPLHARLAEARRLTGAAVRRLRSSLQSLREDADASDQDLPDMLRRLTARHGADQLEVSLEVTGPPVPLAADARRSLFQVASECVFNAAIHGRARRAVIRVGYGRGVVALCVADDGCGKPATLRKLIRGEVPGTGDGYHLGLAGIATWARELGWTVSADRSDLGGVAVRVVAPVAAPAASAASAGGRAHG